MRQVEANIHVLDTDHSLKVTGPTLPIAIAHALPTLSSMIGDPSMVLGVRMHDDDDDDDDDDERSLRLVINQQDHLEPCQLDRYINGDHDASASFEVFDVREELLAAEGLLRQAAAKRRDGIFYDLIYHRGLDFFDAVNNFLIYVPKGKFKLKKKLREIFGGEEWRYWMPPIHRQPIVDVRKIAVVERDEDTLLLRFDYYFCRPGGLSVHGRALEFADLEKGYWKIRRDRFSALRGVAPPFHSKQLRQVYLALQTAVDANWYVDLSAQKAPLCPH